MTAATHTDLRSALLRDGHAMVEGVFDSKTVEALKHALAVHVGDEAKRSRGGSTYALRNVLSLVPRVKQLIQSVGVRDLVASVLGEHAFGVRGILFDKTPAANWKVAWHQDLSIAVQARSEVHGYGPWSVKAGVQHVQPPVNVLRSMVTMRIHLDDCRESNGPLRVIAGSHARGILDAKDVDELSRTGREVTCTGGAGSVLLMSPLVLHASSSASAPGHRRVLHIEFADCELSGGLAWFERVSVR